MPSNSVQCSLVQCALDERPPIKGGNTLTISPSVSKLFSEACCPLTRTILGRSSGTPSAFMRAWTVSCSCTSSCSPDRMACCGRKSRNVAKSLTVTVTLHPSHCPAVEQGEEPHVRAQPCG